MPLLFLACCFIGLQICLMVLLQPERDPALTGREPTEIPESVIDVFWTHDDLLSEAAGYFGRHQEVFAVTREEGDLASGFFSSDVEATAIRKSLGEKGVSLVRRLNEQAYMRSVAYYVPTETTAPALLFNFFPQGYDTGLLIWIDADALPHKLEQTVALLSERHGTLTPLSRPGWYYIE